MIYFYRIYNYLLILKYKIKAFFLKKKLMISFLKGQKDHKNYIRFLEKQLKSYYRQSHQLNTCKCINDLRNIDSNKIRILSRSNKMIEYVYIKDYLPNVLPEMKDLISSTENLIAQNKEKIKLYK